MASRVQMVKSKNLISPPKWLPPNIHYEVMAGSQSYNVQTADSDMDVVGFCIPPKDNIFPHLKGEILGFGNQTQRFDVWQEHHIIDKETDKEYDFSIYSIVKFFQLAMENNPNIIDVLHVPQHCVLFASSIGQMVRDNRSKFLHKGSYQKLRGYAYSQLHKIGTKANSANPKRLASIEKHKYCTKFGYHIVRLVLQSEQILIEHELDIGKNAKILKAVRSGEWSEEKLRSWFDEKEKHLESLYVTSTLRHGPDEEFIKKLLLECLESHYGSLSDAVKMEVPVDRMISELKLVIEKYEGR
jgi:predicted nucleotidyltransferase